MFTIWEHSPLSVPWKGQHRQDSLHLVNSKHEFSYQSFPNSNPAWNHHNFTSPPQANFSLKFHCHNCWCDRALMLHQRRNSCRDWVKWKPEYSALHCISGPQFKQCWITYSWKPHVLFVSTYIKQFDLTAVAWIMCIDWICEGWLQPFFVPTLIYFHLLLECIICTWWLHYCSVIEQFFNLLSIYLLFFLPNTFTFVHSQICSLGFFFFMVLFQVIKHYQTPVYGETVINRASVCGGTPYKAELKAC